jgi:hypothetical protein
MPGHAATQAITPQHVGTLSVAHGTSRPEAPQVPEEFDRLEKTTVESRELIERLEARLGCLLAADPRVDDRNCATLAGRPLCPLAGQVAGISERVAGGNATLRRLIEQLQV